MTCVLRVLHNQPASLHHMHCIGATSLFNVVWLNYLTIGPWSPVFPLDCYCNENRRNHFGISFPLLFFLWWACNVFQCMSFLSTLIWSLLLLDNRPLISLSNGIVVRLRRPASIGIKDMSNKVRCISLLVSRFFNDTCNTFYTSFHLNIYVDFLFCCIIDNPMTFSLEQNILVVSRQTFIFCWEPHQIWEQPSITAVNCLCAIYGSHQKFIAN